MENSLCVCPLWFSLSFNAALFDLSAQDLVLDCFGSPFSSKKIKTCTTMYNYNFPNQGTLQQIIKQEGRLDPLTQTPAALLYPVQTQCPFLSTIQHLLTYFTYSIFFLFISSHVLRFNIANLEKRNIYLLTFFIVLTQLYFKQINPILNILFFLLFYCVQISDAASKSLQFFLRFSKHFLCVMSKINFQHYQ